jgi:APA family basic amino acid/polyamine antiporter
MRGETMTIIPKRKFGFLTTIAMIVGIVIGSGIFYRTDDILTAVGGDVLLGVIAFVIGGLGIVFGGLSIASLAKRDEHVGGIITYCEMTWGKQVGYLAGWFQVFFYYPALVAVIAWVAALYTSILFGFADPLFGLETWILTVSYLTVIFVLNALETKGAGKFQSFAMIAKLGALAVLAVTGLLFGDPAGVIGVGPIQAASGGLLFALVSTAFAYDGWQVAPSIAHEIKDPKKNLPLALTVAPVLIMVLYIAYFLGISAVVGPQEVMALGNASVDAFANQFFGAAGAKVLLVFVVTSVLGTTNGLTLGYIRLPYALALRKEFVASETFAKVSAKTDIPMASAYLTFAVSAFWLVIHFLTLNGAVFYGLSFFGGIDISNLPIVSIYVFYIVIYVGIIKDFLVKKIGNVWEGLIFPVLAIVGAAVVVYGGFTDAKVGLYLIICFVGILAGFLFKPKHA